MALANYTTVVSVDDSIAEIHRLLTGFGANRIATHYDNGKPVGIEFQVRLDGKPLDFRLPINTKAVHKALQGARLTKTQKLPAHAEKVAWRILKDWVRIQLSLVEVAQADLAQVFLPYALMAPDQTVYQGFRAERNRQLGAGA